MSNVSDNFELFLKIVIATKDVLLGGFGGMVAYMFDYSKTKKINDEHKWSNSAMVINLFIGSFVAYSLGTFIPVDAVGRDGIIGLIGVSSYAILGIIESRFAKILLDRLIGVRDEKM